MKAVIIHERVSGKDDTVPGGQDIFYTAPGTISWHRGNVTKIRRMPTIDPATRETICHPPIIEIHDHLTGFQVSWDSVRQWIDPTETIELIEQESTDDPIEKFREALTDIIEMIESRNAETKDYRRLS